MAGRAATVGNGTRRGAAVALGAAGAACGGLLLILAVVAAALDPAALAQALAVGTYGALALALGAAGVRAGRRADAPIRFPPWWALGGGWALAVAIGHAAGALPAAPALVARAVLGGAAIALAAVALLCGSARPEAGPLSWRRLLPPLAWGAIGTVPVVLAAEAALAVAVTLAALVGRALAGRPVDPAAVSAALAGVDASTLDVLALRVLRDPLVVAGVFAVVVVGGPLLEEVGKFFPLPLLRLSDPLAGWRAGVASGAGFGMAESAFYLLQATGDDWWQQAIARSLTPLLHAAACGLIGAAWSRHRHHRRAGSRSGWGPVGWAVGAVALHACWNGLFLATTLTQVWGGAAMSGVAGAVRVACYGALAAQLLGTVWLLRRLPVTDRDPTRGRVGRSGPSIPDSPWPGAPVVAPANPLGGSPSGDPPVATTGDPPIAASPALPPSASGGAHRGTSGPSGPSGVDDTRGEDPGH